MASSETMLFKDIAPSAQIVTTHTHAIFVLDFLASHTLLDIQGTRSPPMHAALPSSVLDYLLVII
jgi:hypothetical protein